MTEGSKQHVLSRDCRVAALLAMTQSKPLGRKNISCCFQFQAAFNVIANAVKQSLRVFLYKNRISCLTLLTLLLLKTAPLIRTLP